MKEVVARFEEAASKQWNIVKDASLSEIRENADGSVTVVAKRTTENGEELLEIPADAVLVATGRRPNTDTLNAKNYFDVQDGGQLSVDKYQRVLYNGAPVPGVYALGDVSSRYQLKHVANHEARVVQRQPQPPRGPACQRPPLRTRRGLQQPADCRGRYDRRAGAPGR